MATGPEDKKPGGVCMGCCMCKKALKILAGLALLYVGLTNMVTNQIAWIILGLYLLLVGVAPFVCKCEGCETCKMEGKKKK
jgi:hypothetical protein